MLLLSSLYLGNLIHVVSAADFTAFRRKEVKKGSVQHAAMGRGCSDSCSNRETISSYYLQGSHLQNFLLFCFLGHFLQWSSAGAGSPGGHSSVPCMGPWRITDGIFMANTAVSNQHCTVRSINKVLHFNSLSDQLHLQRQSIMKY